MADSILPGGVLLALALAATPAFGQRAPRAAVATTISLSTATLPRT